MLGDGVALLCGHPCKLTARCWVRRKACEVAFFKSNLLEARWQPIIHLEGQLVRFVSLSKFLRVTFDRTIPYVPHAAKITAKAEGRYKVLTSLTTKRWRLEEDRLAKIFQAVPVENHKTDRPFR